MAGATNPRRWSDRKEASTISWGGWCHGCPGCDGGGSRARASDGAVNGSVRRFLLNWLAAFLGVYVAALILPGIHVGSSVGVAIFAVALGLLNAFAEPV